MKLVVFACDAGPARGAGHVMRCVALAEELAARGIGAVFVADVTEVPWTAAQITTRGFGLIPRREGEPGLVAALLASQPDAVVIDSYVVDARVSAAIRASGVPVLAIIDGDDRGQSADLYVDQNLGAESDPWRGPERLGPEWRGPEWRGPEQRGSERLAGLGFALMRDEILAVRPPEPRRDTPAATPVVLGHFGGTDPAGAAPVLARALAASRAAFDATFVAAVPALAAEIAAVPLGRDQRISVIGPVTDLAGRAASADLVVCASGTSVWEMLCVGAAAAVTWVADNQAEGYRRSVASGAVAGLGHVAAIRDAPHEAAAVLKMLLQHPGARTAMRATAWSLVDGAGRARVATALSRRS